MSHFTWEIETAEFEKVWHVSIIWNSNQVKSFKQGPNTHELHTHMTAHT